MASWPSNGTTDWNTAMKAAFETEHNNNGTHGVVTATSVASDSIAVSGDAVVSGFLNLGTATELTISSGVVTATGSYHTIDTEGDAASDDLVTINGGSEGDVLFIRAANSARSVVVKDGTGNIQTPGDFTLDNAADTVQLLHDGSNWLALGRSSNA